MSDAVHPPGDVAARRVLFPTAAMNQIAFASKRTFHGFLRVTRRMFASYGLTAARFDLLYAIVGDRRGDGGPRGARQSQLWRRLGVTAPVVSRMLRSLESVGLVTRTADVPGDRRQRYVTVTERGEAAMAAGRRVIRRGVQRLVDAAICFGAHRSPVERFANMAKLEGYLDVLRRDFGDRATLYFPWGHPDD